MSFNIRQLDNLSYDDAEPLLEDYITKLVTEFLNSPQGGKLRDKDPTTGHWCDTFIEFGYRYGEKTLPQMTIDDVKMLMEYTLPRKLTVASPEDAETAIPELVEFWRFMGDRYKLRRAKPITVHLRKIKNKFPKWMFDERRGGIAKQFMMAGLEEGIDISNPDELNSFMEVFNQRQEAQSPSPILQPPNNPLLTELENLTNFDPNEPLDESQLKVVMQALSQIIAPEMGEIDADELLDAFLNDEIPPSLEATMAEDEGSGETQQDEAFFPGLTERDFDPSSSWFSPNWMRRLTISGGRGYYAGDNPDLPVVSSEEEALIKQQTITADAPGTILNEFQVLLDYLQDGPVPVSNSLSHFSKQQCLELNECLQNSIQIDKARPKQANYPFIQGLYLLLRATQIVTIEPKGKKTYLGLNPEVFEQWQSLNPTEKYLTLLEAWLTRGVKSFLAKHQGSFGNFKYYVGDFVLGNCTRNNWFKVNEPFKVKTAHEQLRLENEIKLYNVALMSLFGFMTVQDAKPEAGGGWNIQTLTLLPFGQAMLKVCQKIALENQVQFPIDQDASAPLNAFQPTFQPYFPEWKQVPTYPKPEFQPDLHIFKVTMERFPKVWSKLAISGNATLFGLSLLILESVNFDNDHLHTFSLQNPLGRIIEIDHPFCESGNPATSDYLVGQLPLTIGQGLEYLFDFGDHWEFSV